MKINTWYLKIANWIEWNKRLKEEEFLEESTAVLLRHKRGVRKDRCLENWKKKGERIFYLAANEINISHSWETKN